MLLPSLSAHWINSPSVKLQRKGKSKSFGAFVLICKRFLVKAGPQTHRSNTVFYQLGDVCNLTEADDRPVEALWGVWMIKHLREQGGVNLTNYHQKHILWGQFICFVTMRKLEISSLSLAVLLHPRILLIVTETLTIWSDTQFFIVCSRLGGTLTLDWKL